MGTHNEYYITVDLSEISKNLPENYRQFVYASQLYNTYFEIYAKFDTEVTSEKVTIKNHLRTYQLQRVGKYWIC